MDARSEVISSARNLAGEGFDADLAYGGGPGRFEAVSDTELALAVDIIGMHGFGFAGGDTELGLHGIAVGPFVLTTDSVGFHDILTFDSDDAAESFVDQLPTYDEEESV